MAGLGYAATNGSRWTPLPQKAAGMYSVAALLLFTIAKVKQTSKYLLCSRQVAQAHLQFTCISAGRLEMGWDLSQGIML